MYYLYICTVLENMFIGEKKMSESIKTSSTYNAYDICAIKINQRFKSPNLREKCWLRAEMGCGGKGEKGCEWWVGLPG